MGLPEFWLLGEPGAGKTTMLLDLASELLDRAEQNENLPIPVVFPLSPWAEKRQALEEWLVDELNTRYRIPHKLAKVWVTTDHVLPLLDGLDEVVADARVSCIKAINAYRKAHGLVPLVVCSRSGDYLTQPTRLELDMALVIQPLTLQQMNEYLSGFDGDTTAIHNALQTDTILQEMAQTLLMLNILVLTYRHETFQVSQSLRHKRIFQTYVEVMLKRRGLPNQYSSEQTIHWPAFLAKNLQKHNQTEFYLERLQQDWLSDNSRQTYHMTLVRVVYGIEWAAISGLFAWLRGGRVGSISGVSTGLLGWLGASPGNSILGWMAPGMGGGLEGGGMLGIIFFLATLLITIIIDSYSQTTSRKLVLQVHTKRPTSRSL